MGGDLDSATKWRMAKFAAVGVPMLITGGLASLSVHSPDNRARIEPYMPGFGTSYFIPFVSPGPHAVFGRSAILEG